MDFNFNGEQQFLLQPQQQLMQPVQQQLWQRDCGSNQPLMHPVQQPLMQLVQQPLMQPVQQLEQPLMQQIMQQTRQPLMLPLMQQSAAYDLNYQQFLQQQAIIQQNLMYGAAMPQLQYPYQSSLFHPLHAISSQQLLTTRLPSSPSLSKVEVPSLSKVEVPSLSKVEVPSFPKEDVPSSSKVDLPSSSKVDLPSSSKVEVPLSSKGERPLSSNRVFSGFTDKPKSKEDRADIKIHAKDKAEKESVTSFIKTNDASDDSEESECEESIRRISRKSVHSVETEKGDDDESDDEYDDDIFFSKPIKPCHKRKVSIETEEEDDEDEVEEIKCKKTLRKKERKPKAPQKKAGRRKGSMNRKPTKADISRALDEANKKIAVLEKKSRQNEDCFIVISDDEQPADSPNEVLSNNDYIEPSIYGNIPEDGSASNMPDGDGPVISRPDEEGSASNMPDGDGPVTSMPDEDGSASNMPDGYGPVISMPGEDDPVWQTPPDDYGHYMAYESEALPFASKYDVEEDDTPEGPLCKACQVAAPLYLIVPCRHFGLCDGCKEIYDFCVDQRCPGCGGKHFITCEKVYF